MGNWKQDGDVVLRERPNQGRTEKRQSVADPEERAQAAGFAEKILNRILPHLQQATLSGKFQSRR